MFEQRPERWVDINLTTLPVAIVKTNWSGFTVCLVSGSAKQYSLATWLKSSRCPVLLSCLSIWIRWCVSFCSGRCVVWAVVTKLFASVRVWMGTISPLISAHKALKSKHVPKHFIKAFNSATVGSHCAGTTWVKNHKSRMRTKIYIFTK